MSERNTEAPEAILMWNRSLDGASVAIPVDSLSREDSDEAFESVGIDDDTGHGYLERRDGSRLFLTTIDADHVREAASLAVVVVCELEREGRGLTREYPVASQIDQAPSMGA